MTISDKLFFNFDGIPSSQFNLVHINMSNDMYEENFASNTSIREQAITGGNPIFYGVEREPIEFELNLAYEGQFTERLLDETVRWLFVDYYKPLYFIGRESKIYYCMPVGEPKITHNGMQEGYITVNFRCNSPYIYSPLRITDLYEVNGERTIEFYNDGHVDAYPEISINKIGLGDVTITNLSDGGKFLKFSNLTDKEDLYIDCEKEIIETDLIGQHRYNSMSGDFLKILYGSNSLKITGNCTIQFRSRFKYKF